MAGPGPGLGADGGTSQCSIEWFNGIHSLGRTHPGASPSALRSRHCQSATAINPHRTHSHTTYRGYTGTGTGAVPTKTLTHITRTSIYCHTAYYRHSYRTLVELRYAYAYARVSQPCSQRTDQSSSTTLPNMSAAAPPLALLISSRS
jgi:hypothetical protein